MGVGSAVRIFKQRGELMSELAMTKVLNAALKFEKDE